MFIFLPCVSNLIQFETLTLSWAGKERQKLMAKRKNIGSEFNKSLKEEGLLANVDACTAKRMLAFQIQQEMEKQRLTKTEMAAKMHTSRAALNRLLDPKNTAVTFNTLDQAATALGKRLRITMENTVRS